MKYAHRLLLALTVAALILPFPPAWSWDFLGPILQLNGGGVVAPRSEHKTIRMDSEEVIIRLKSNSYVVDVVFNMFNTGETRTELTGFPKCVMSGDHFPSFLKFEGWVNGVSTEFKDEEDRVAEGDIPGAKTFRDSFLLRTWKHPKDYLKWLVSDITFPGHATTAIRIRYQADYCNESCEAAYLLGTGSLWKDNIGKAVFIIDSTEVGGPEKILTYFAQGSREELIAEKAIEAPKTILKNVARYEIRDFKPDPKAYVRIKLCDDFHRRYAKANYIKQKPACGPVPMAPPPMMPMKVVKWGSGGA